MSNFGHGGERLTVDQTADGSRIEEPRVPFEVICASLVINLLALGMPLVILQVYDRILPNRAAETLLALMAGLAGVVLIDFVLKSLRSRAIGWSGGMFGQRATIEGLRRLMKAPHGMVEREPVAAHVTRLGAVASIGDYHSGPSRLMAIDLPFVSLFLLLMALVGGTIVVIPLTLFVIFLGLAMRRSRALRDVLHERSQRENRKYDFVLEALSGVHTVKSMAMEQPMQRRFERLQQAVAETSYRSLLLSGSAQGSAALYGNISQIAVVAYGGLLVIDGRLSLGALACCTLLAGQILQPLLRAIALWSEQESVGFKREEAAQLFAFPPVVSALNTEPLDPGSIVFDKVGYAYGPQGPTVLHDVSFTIAPGEVIAVRGADGSGRSTLVRLMRGDLAPTSGSARIAGLDPSGPDAATLRNVVAYVGPTPSIFRGSILDNVTMFDPTRREAAREAARLVGLEEVVHNLPEGYDTKVGDVIAEELPGSFAQKIALTRAIVRSPRLLVLDEANTPLDRRSEEKLVAMIAALRGRIGIIIVTHRPSLMALADRVLALDYGSVRFDGAAKPEAASAG